MTTYRIEFCIEKDDDGSYFGYCPQLRGCIANGDTIEELQDNLLDSAELYINSLKRHGDPIPLSEGKPFKGKPLIRSTKCRGDNVWHRDLVIGI
jgi:predicted RNase H-like HicB family nuclease